jgi:hypothetical protein
MDIQGFSPPEDIAKLDVQSKLRILSGDNPESGSPTSRFALYRDFREFVSPDSSRMQGTRIVTKLSPLANAGRLVALCCL